MSAKTKIPARSADISNQALSDIANAAISGDVQRVREILSKGVNYRKAYLYVEAFHQDYKASKLIQREAKCKCGNLATKWNPEPICQQCCFQKSMSQIEYG